MITYLYELSEKLISLGEEMQNAGMFLIAVSVAGFVTLFFLGLMHPDDDEI